MFKAFKERRPWAAAAINLFFGPFLGMLYLGRAGIAFIYFGIGFVFGATLLFFFPLAIAIGSLGIWLVELPVTIVGTFHATRLARIRVDEAVLPRYSRWYSLVAINLSFLAVALLVRTFLYQPFDAPSASMEPSINVGDYFWASKRAYGQSLPERGDIVVFHGRDGDYVKRIAGVPGDKVQMVQGRFVLNGTPVSRKRIADLVIEDEYGIARPVRQYQETLRSGRSYRTLDLMNNSPQDNTSVFVVPADSYFVLGDNRDNSNDSRFEMGPVTRASIVGRVVVKFADRKHKTMIWEPVE